VTVSISVICPAWQAARTLPETLASVRAQTLLPAEILVIDDGSTDSTAELAEANGARVIRRAHAGPAVTLNAGIAASRGQLLAFVDADDLWTPDKLARQTQALAADAELGGVLGMMESFLCPSLPAEVASRYRLSEAPQRAWVLGTLLAHRTIFAAVGPLAEDMMAGFVADWFDRARHAGLRFAVLDQVVLRRRIHPGTLSHRSKARDRGYALMARRALLRRRTLEEKSG
jgi:glycosyltransferase involved in cell wall biosynthesis